MNRLHRLLLQCTLVLLAIPVLVYAGDWTVLHLRVLKGTAYSTIRVDHFLVTTLKGGRAEYDYLGQDDITCSRSLFPQTGHSPCWYVEKHKNDWVVN